MPIHRCVSCKPHPIQDALYGKNMRVMNPCKPEDKKRTNCRELRCTVCQATHSNPAFTGVVKPKKADAPAGAAPAKNAKAA